MPLPNAPNCKSTIVVPITETAHLVFLFVVFSVKQIKCYHKSEVTSERQVVFRLQFHTGAVQGYSLTFDKEDMEAANKGTSPAMMW